MDDFELFKARASGCPVPSDEELERLRVYHQEREESEGRGEREGKGGRRKSHRNHKNPTENQDERLSVKVEIQPPSPIVSRKLFNGEEELETNLGSSSPRARQGRHSLSSKPVSARLGEDILSSEDPMVRRTKSCRHNSIAQPYSNSKLHFELPPKHISNHSRGSLSFQKREQDKEEWGEEEKEDENQPRVYRVRSFTTKKGEIINRGDSFKVCANNNFLTVAGNLSTRRCSEAAQSKSQSRLDVKNFNSSVSSSLTPRRSSYACVSTETSTFNKRKPSFESKQTNGVTFDSSFSYRPQTNQIENFIMSSHDKLSNKSLNGTLQEEMEGVPIKEERGKGSTNDLVFGEPFHILVVGSGGVGKTTLINQLMTSEYLANNEHNDQEDEEDPQISVVLDEMEYTVHFHETFPFQPFPEELPHAYLLVFSVVERTSFSFIKTFLQEIFLKDPRLKIETETNKEKPSLRFLFNRNSKPFPLPSSPLHPSKQDLPLSSFDKKINNNNNKKNVFVKQNNNNNNNINNNNNNNKNNSCVFSSTVFVEKEENFKYTTKKGEGEGEKESEKEDEEEEERETNKQTPVIYIVANKQDLVRNRAVSEADIKKLLQTRKDLYRYGEVSALLDHNVDQVLVKMVREIRREWEKEKERGREKGKEKGRVKEEVLNESTVTKNGCLYRAMLSFCGRIFS